MLFARYYFWIAPHVLLAIVGLGLFRQNLHRRFPFFFSYVVCELIQFLILLPMSSIQRFSLATFRWALVSGLVVSLAAKCGVLGEASRELLYRQSSLWPALTSWLRAIGAGLLLGASLASMFLFRADVPRLERIFRALDFSLSMILSGLLLLLLLLARYLHVSLRSYTAGILLGFGIYSTVGLASAALRAELPRSAEIAIGLAQMAAYHVAVVVWLAYLLAGKPSLERKEKRLPELDLEFWNQELERMVGR
jgi:hypothetical protein